MKLNFIEKFKDKKLKKQKINEKKREKKTKTNVIFVKKKYFVKDCRLINVINRRELNVLRTILVKKKYQENDENELNFLKVITNDKYY